MLLRFPSFSLLLMLALLLGTVRSHAVAYAEVESVYEGDGWFRYTVNLPVYYFHMNAIISGFGVFFGPAQTVATTEGWTESAGANWLNNDPLTRPSQYVFRCRSTYRHFKRHDGACVFSLNYQPENGIPLNGIAWCPGLVPCPPAEADDSPAVLAVKLELEPDLKILNLNHDDGKLTGLQLNWQTGVTYMLEASSNLTTWREVTTFYAGSGTVSFPSLSESGPFFRVRVSEIPPSFMLASAIEQATASRIVKEANFEIKKGRVAAVFPSQEGASYIVEFLSTHGKPLKKIEVVGAPGKTSILLPSDLSATSVLLRVSSTSSDIQ